MTDDPRVTNETLPADLRPDKRHARRYGMRRYIKLILYRLGWLRPATIDGRCDWCGKQNVITRNKCGMW